jgi:hypothetical protein
MKTLMKIFALACCISLNLSLFSQISAFSGTWILNETKSKMGESQLRIASVKINMGQKKNLLVIETTQLKPDGEKITLTEKYTLDGKEKEFISRDQVKKSKVTLADNKKSFTIKSESIVKRDGKKINFSMEDVFVLSEDGLNLTIDSKSSSQKGEYHAILAFDKAGE